MSEMLGNQFFLARNFAGAAKELEEALQHDPESKSIRRKLVICLNEIGEVRRAFTYFISLVKEDAEYIIQTDPIDDDCPCPELVYEAERALQNNDHSLDYILRLGMLWLYCDMHESMRYFKKAQELAPDDGDIKTIITLLKPKEIISH